ncbi:VWA domain-containing protein [Patescibacteria group bacterium]
MKKKIALTLVALVVVVGGVAAISAFEAHIINVTAHIENALSVDPQEIAFGTVFPQEYLEKDFTVSLSSSFLSEDRVDDVEYVIKQKPKCKSDTITDPANPDMYAPVDYATHLCPDGYTAMISLCPFLSKTDADPEDNNDTSHPSYYFDPTPDAPNSGDELCETVTADATGYLSKAVDDLVDAWIVDLKVPPVEGYVGQDWPESCPIVETNDQDYGCDLWIEVNGISLPGGLGCLDKASLMLVLDRSGSIDSGELTTMKTAAKAFVDALTPSTDGVHMGEVSFSSTAVLDVQLTDDGAVVKAAIDALSSGGTTNLEDAIQKADAELESGRDRPDTESPDFMVIITDGAPTTSNSGGDYAADAKAAADAAKADGIEIYVVGVGTDTSTTAYLRDQIASGADHYFDATNWADLQTILEGIASCS